MTGRGRCWHALHDRSFRLLGQGGVGPIGTVDSTAMGPLARLLSGHSARPVGAFSALRQLADRSRSRHQAGETSGQTSHREDTTRIIAVRSFSTNSRPALRRPPAAAVLGRQAPWWGCRGWTRGLASAQARCVTSTNTVIRAAGMREPLASENVSVHPSYRLSPAPTPYPFRVHPLRVQLCKPG